MSQYQIYEHRETHRQAIILEDNSGTKFKTVLLKFLDDNTEKVFSISTIKRWWKKTEEVYKDLTQEVMEQKKELEIEVPPIDPEKVEVLGEEEVTGDGTPYGQVLKEILHDEKLAVQKKKVSKGKRPVFDSTSLQEYAIQVLTELGGDYKQRVQDNGSKDMAQKAFRAGGKMFMHMCYPRYNLYFNTRGVDTEKFPPDAELTGFYSVRYIFTEDNKQTRAKIKEIITQAYNAQLNKNNSKKGKGDK